MKLVKMSLLAATLIASSAFAIDNVKVSGDAKLFYHTDDASESFKFGGASLGGATNVAAGETKGTLFDKGNSIGQASATVGLTADLTEGVSAGVSIIALSTLGLEGQLVSGVWEYTNGTDDSFWFDEAWIAGTVGKTTGKIGRMELDTPLVFSETWSVATNTFEAAVLLNQDIPDTTLVGAYVGGSNGGFLLNRSVIAETNTSGSAGIGSATNFHQFYNGAFAAGVVNNSWAPLTAQAWYYDASSVADAYWLQADLALDFGLTVGAQFTGLDIKEGTLAGTALVDSSNTAFAVKAGYEVKDIVTVSAAFSQTGKDDSTNDLGAGMNLAAYGQSKLYTEAWWNYGYITNNDTTAFNVTATTPEELTWAQLGLYVTSSIGTDGIAAGTDTEMVELTLEAAKSFGALDVGIYYILTDANDLNIAAGDAADEGQSFNSVQAYLTYNF